MLEIFVETAFGSAGSAGGIVPSPVPVPSVPVSVPVSLPASVPGSAPVPVSVVVDVDVDAAVAEDVLRLVPFAPAALEAFGPFVMDFAEALVAAFGARAFGAPAFGAFGPAIFGALVFGGRGETFCPAAAATVTVANRIATIVANSLRVFMGILRVPFIHKTDAGRRGARKLLHGNVLPLCARLAPPGRATRTVRPVAKFAGADGVRSRVQGGICGHI